MARFIEPARLEYISQYVPLPIDLMVKKLETEEKGYETADTALAAYKAGIKGGMRTRDLANQLNKKISEQAESLVPILESGDWRGAISKLKQYNSELQKDPLYRVTLGDYEYLKNAQQLYKEAREKGNLGQEKWFDPLSGEVKQLTPEEAELLGDFTESLYGIIPYQDLPKKINETFNILRPIVSQVTGEDIDNLFLDQAGNLMYRTTSGSTKILHPSQDVDGRIYGAINELVKTLEDNYTNEGRYYQAARNQGLINSQSYPTTEDFIKAHLPKFYVLETAASTTYSPVPVPPTGRGGGGASTIPPDKDVYLSEVNRGEVVETDGTIKAAENSRRLKNKINISRNNLNDAAIHIADMMGIDNPTRARIMSIYQQDPNKGLIEIYNEINNRLTNLKASGQIDQKLENEIKAWNSKYEQYVVDLYTKKYYDNYKDKLSDFILTNKNLDIHRKIDADPTLVNVDRPTALEFIQDVLDIKNSDNYKGYITALDLKQLYSKYPKIVEKYIQLHVPEDPYLDNLNKYFDENSYEFSNISRGILFNVSSSYEKLVKDAAIKGSKAIENTVAIYGENNPVIKDFSDNIIKIFQTGDAFAQVAQRAGLSSHKDDVKDLFKHFGVYKHSKFELNKINPGQLTSAQLVPDTKGGIPMVLLTFEQKDTNQNKYTASMIVPLSSLNKSDSEKVYLEMIRSSKPEVAETGALGYAWTQIDDTERTKLYNLEYMDLLPGDNFDVTIDAGGQDFTISKYITSQGTPVYNLLVNGYSDGETYTDIETIMVKIGKFHIFNKFRNNISGNSNTGGPGGTSMGKSNQDLQLLQ